MPVHLIDEAAPLALSIPLQRGWMVCHVLSSYGFKNLNDNTCYNHPRF
jgi:hypothetical protein